MSAERDVTRSVRSWLRTDEQDSADRVLEAVLDALDTTPQRRRSWWPARRVDHLNAVVKYGLAAAVVAATVLALNYFTTPSVGGPAIGDPTASASAGGSPVSIPALNGQVPLDAGRYQVPLPTQVTVTVEVPDGWSAGGNWVVRGPSGPEAPDGMAIRFYTVSNIYKDPLRIDEGRIEPRVGPSVDDLVVALTGHPAWTITGVDPIAIDGFEGQVLHVTLPPETSDETPFYLFAPGGGGVVFAGDPDQTLDIYIVDAAGKRLVIEAFHFPSTSESDLAAQDAVLRSIQIEPAP